MVRNMKNKAQKMALWSAVYQISLDNAQRAHEIGHPDGAKRHEALQEAKHVARTCAKTALCDFENTFEGKET